MYSDDSRASYIPPEQYLGPVHVETPPDSPKSAVSKSEFCQSWTDEVRRAIPPPPLPPCPDEYPTPLPLPSDSLTSYGWQEPQDMDSKTWGSEPTEESKPGYRVSITGTHSETLLATLDRVIDKETESIEEDVLPPPPRLRFGPDSLYVSPKKGCE